MKGFFFCMVHEYRMECVRAVLQDGMMDDPLDNEGELQDQLDSLPHLFRFQYENTCLLVSNMMDPIIQKLQGWSTGQPGDQ